MIITKANLNRAQDCDCVVSELDSVTASETAATAEYDETLYCVNEAI